VLSSSKEPGSPEVLLSVGGDNPLSEPGVYAKIVINLQRSQSWVDIVLKFKG
jgi:hypothetical protein